MAKIITFPYTAPRISGNSPILVAKRSFSPHPEWLLCAGFVSLFGGVLAGLTGAILLVISLVPGAQSLHNLGSGMLISILPALLLGGLALDRYEARTHLHGR